MRPLLLLLTLATACSSSSAVGKVRFVNAPPALHVDDRRPIPKPRENTFMKGFYYFDSFYLRAKRAINLTRERRALGVNSVDDVPNSTWFTNRIGTYALTNEEIASGPGHSTPEAHLPWTIESSKAGGISLGFIATDARGVKFVLKFEQAGIAEMETAADAVVARLLWAAGYNVASDHVVYFKRGDLVVGKDAYTKNKAGDKVPIDAAYLDEKLQRMPRGADGRMRALASMFIEGKVLGGTHRLGVRKDDPNDRIPHQLRRDQRGQAAFFAWLMHTDAKEDNTLDTWQEDPANKAVHYVMHYLIDVGNSLGTHAFVNRRPSIGYSYDIDPGNIVLSLATLGLYRHEWEGRRDPKIPGVGLYTSHLYDPGAWKANTFSQIPLLYADRFDQFWGAKILMRFTRAQLAAAVSAGRYSDPRASEYLLDTLIARQRKTAWFWFNRVNPIDEPAIEQGQLCFTDLAVRHGLTTLPTTFTISAFDAQERALGPSRVTAPDRFGRACLPAAPLAAGEDSYTIVRIESSRPDLPATLIHMATDAARKLRVIGLYRH